jgi:hypothetical protein
MNKDDANAILAAWTALHIARAYLIEEGESGSVWSSLGNAKAVDAIDVALNKMEPGWNDL